MENEIFLKRGFFYRLVITKIRGMTGYRGILGQESCMRMFFRRNGVLDVDDGFSDKKTNNSVYRIYYLEFYSNVF